MDGPTDIVIEIVSPESVQRDYEEKLKLWTPNSIGLLNQQSQRLDVRFLGVSKEPLSLA